MNDLRTAAQQALEALQEYQSNGAPFLACDGAVAALKAALTQQDEPVEPVAWSGYNLDGMVEAFSRVIEAHHSSKHPFHNPIDMDARMALRILRGFIPAMKAYAAPPQQAEPVEPVAWRTFDGEGGYDYRTYADNENYAAEWAQRNPRHVGWVKPLYTAPPQRKPLTIERLRDALVASRIIPPAAVEDPDGYDDGLTLFRIEALHRRIT